MSTDETDTHATAALGLGYATLQLVRAQQTAHSHPDATVRARAVQRVARWYRILQQGQSGRARYGSRTPLAGIPAWVTLDIATGGFATGELSAGGGLSRYEQDLASTLPGIRPGHERCDLNLYFLSEHGRNALWADLLSGSYAIELPEHAALPVVAWLLQHGREDEAQAIVGTIAPFFDRLRFFPAPAAAEPPSSSVFLASAGRIRAELLQLAPPRAIMTQREAITRWLPTYDTAVELFLDTYIDGWPCQHYRPGWTQRAAEAVSHFTAAQQATGWTKEPQYHRVAELHAWLQRCGTAPQALSGRDVGRIRRIVDDFVRRYGRPGSEQHRQLRQRQRNWLAAPTRDRAAKAVADRLGTCAADDGIADITALLQPISAEEAKAFSLPVAAPLPPSVQRRIQRTTLAPIATLVEQGLVGSGDVLAVLLPQLSAQIDAAAIDDEALRRLYAKTYQAFRRRRSLLLLDLQRQVALHELPWVAAIKPQHARKGSAAARARELLASTAALALTAFPHALLPNTLLREFRALARIAGLPCELAEELAADIFMGRFSGVFVRAAKRAMPLLAGTLYANYYGIDARTVQQVMALPEPKAQDARAARDEFADLCAQRADTHGLRRSPAVNGCVIEQQQILTTHNLAPLFLDLDLADRLQPQLPAMALACFDWICRRQEMKIPERAQLVSLKNGAYAWRQMLFYLSLADASGRDAALAAIGERFHTRKPALRQRFKPVLAGLWRAAAGTVLPPGPGQARAFLGWSAEPHWLLPPKKR